MNFAHARTRQPRVDTAFDTAGRAKRLGRGARSSLQTAALYGDRYPLRPHTRHSTQTLVPTPPHPTRAPTPAAFSRVRFPASLVSSGVRGASARGKDAPRRLVSCRVVSCRAARRGDCCRDVHRSTSARGDQDEDEDGLCGQEAQGPGARHTRAPRVLRLASSPHCALCTVAVHGVV